MPTRRARVERTIVRAPRDGRVLVVYAHAGQRVGEDGIVAFGETTEMFVEAVYRSLSPAARSTR